MLGIISETVLYWP